MNDKVSTMILYISYHILTMVMVIPTGHNKVGQSKSLWSPSSVNISKCFFMMHKLSPFYYAALCIHNQVKSSSSH